MVTLLVCLVVVGGASILILRVTLEDVFQGATGDLASHGGSSRRSLSSRADAFLARRRDAGSHPDGSNPLPGPSASATIGPPGAHVPPEPAAASTSSGHAPTRSAVAAVAGSGGGLPHGDVVGRPVVRRGEAPTSSVLLEERTTAERTTEARTTEARTTPERTIAERTTAERTTEERTTAERTTEERTTEVRVAEAAEPERKPGPQVAVPPPARDRRPPVAPREPLPPLRRRLLRRLAGAVKLLVLLVLVGSVLALLLGAAALLFAYAVRAAIGA